MMNAGDTVLDRHDSLEMARAIYRGMIKQYPSRAGRGLRPHPRTGPQRSAGHDAGVSCAVAAGAAASNNRAQQLCPQATEVSYFIQSYWTALAKLRLHGRSQLPTLERLCW